MTWRILKTYYLFFGQLKKKKTYYLNHCNLQVKVIYIYFIHYNLQWSVCFGKVRNSGGCFRDFKQNAVNNWGTHFASSGLVIKIHSRWHFSSPFRVLLKLPSFASLTSLFSSLSVTRSLSGLLLQRYILFSDPPSHIICIPVTLSSMLFSIPVPLRFHIRSHFLLFFLFVFYHEFESVVGSLFELWFD